MRVTRWFSKLQLGFAFFDPQAYNKAILGKMQTADWQHVRLKGPVICPKSCQAKQTNIQVTLMQSTF